MKEETVLASIIAVISGGSLVAIINAFANRKKNSSDIAQSNIDTAIKLRNSAVEEYNTVEEKLTQARKLLDEVQLELSVAREHIRVLEAILDKHGIIYPKLQERYDDGDKSDTTQNQ